MGRAELFWLVHISNVMRQTVNRADVFTSGHSTTKPYACDQCDFVTAYENGLAKHKYNVHEVDHKLFECELCHVQLRSKQTYTEHIGRHFNHRKKKCEVCEKTFPSKFSLHISVIPINENRDGNSR